METAHSLLLCWYSVRIPNTVFINTVFILHWAFMHGPINPTPYPRERPLAKFPEPPGQTLSWGLLGPGDGYNIGIEPCITAKDNKAQTSSKCSSTSKNKFTELRL